MSLVQGSVGAEIGSPGLHIDFALPTDGDLAQGFLDYEKKAVKSVMDYGFLQSGLRKVL